MSVSGWGQSQSGDALSSGEGQGAGPSRWGQFQPAVSPTGAEALDIRREEIMRNAERTGNLRIGKADFSFNAGVTQSYNDNVTLSKSKAVSDFITSPFVGMNMNWPVTQLNSLNLSFGLGYDKYWDHPQFDTQNVLISPTSALDFDFYVKDIQFNLHDNIAIEQDPVLFPQLSNVSTFRHLSNDSGISAAWDLNKIKLKAGYDHQIFQSLESDFDFVNHTTELAQASAGWQIDAPYTVGVDFDAAHNVYERAFQNNSDSYSLAGFLNWIITQRIQARASAGYQISDFDHGGGVNDNTDFHSVVASGALRHQVNQFMSHTLSFSDSTQLGIGSNFTEIKEIDYSLTSTLIRNITTTFDAFYEWFDDSPSPLAENATQYGVGILFEYEFIKDSKTGLGFQRTQKDSNTSQNGYEQNRVYLNFVHHF